MGNPVRFYSMTPEEFEKLRKQMERGPDGVEESSEFESNEFEQAKRDFENGIFFIEDKREVNDNGCAK